MTALATFPYVAAGPAHPATSPMPYVPLTLSSGDVTVALLGLADTGATVSVLPYHVGLELGLAWDDQRTPIQLTGNLAQAPARAVLVNATIEPLPMVRLAFAWTRLTEVPLILGQVNFFLEFDVCFMRAQSKFEIRPRQLSPSSE